MNGIGLDSIGLCRKWIGMDWIVLNRLDWIGLDWTALDWIGPEWIGLNELDWIGLA